MAVNDSTENWLATWFWGPVPYPDSSPEATIVKASSSSREAQLHNDKDAFPLSIFPGCGVLFYTPHKCMNTFLLHSDVSLGSLISTNYA